MSKVHLTFPEELVLSILDTAPAQPVGAMCETMNRGGYDTMKPAVLDNILTRLFMSKCVTFYMSEPRPERGGRRRRIYNATKSGIRALRKHESIRAKVYSLASEVND